MLEDNIPTITDIKKGEESDLYRDKGGRILKGGCWRVFLFEVEVAVESPKIVDEEEAAEDAWEFMQTVNRTQGRVHSSFASITRVAELPIGLALAELQKEKIAEIAESKRTAGKPASKVKPELEQAYEDAVPTVLTDSPKDGKIKHKAKKGVKKATKARKI